MAKYIYDLGGEVIGFEPQRIVYYQLCGNVVLNRLDNYQAIHCAVGDTLGEIEVPDLDYERADNIGSFSLDRDIRKLNGSDRFIKKTSQNVPMITLDSLRLSSLVSLIKIDVEGFELSVLKGASDFISRNNFPPILFEAWNQKWFKSEKTELLNFVSQLGYDIYNFGTSDYIAVRSADVMLSEFDLPGVNIRKL
jgi:FkbM family methyltransferase